MADIIKFKGTAYTKDGIAQMSELHLLELYNQLAEELGHRPYAKFASIEAGQKRTWGALIAVDAAKRSQAAPNAPTPASAGKTGGKAGKKGSLSKVDKEPTLSPGDATVADTTTKGSQTMKKQTKKTTARRATPKAGKEASRTHNRVAGKKLYLVGKENPAREGTDAFKGLALIMKHPGMTAEDYIKKGGPRKVLTRSIRTGLVNAK